MRDWLIRPKRRTRRPWLDVLGGCLFVAFGAAFGVLQRDTTLRVLYALWIVVGIRWIVVGMVQRRDRAADGNST